LVFFFLVVSFLVTELALRLTVLALRLTAVALFEIFSLSCSYCLGFFFLKTIRTAAPTTDPVTATPV